MYHLVWLVLQKEKVQLHDLAPHLDFVMDHPEKNVHIQQSMLLYW